MKDAIENRLKEYQPKTKQEELNVFKEICQEIALCGLARGEFFKKGAFQGGTCLRIVYGLQRFSEDLGFVLFTTETNFSWEQYLKAIDLEFASFGLSLEVVDRSQIEGSIKRAFLKENSFAKVLELKYGFLSSTKQSVKIKLEIDVNPPKGSSYDTHYLDYPYPFAILCQDKKSLFASKCHSLLCRKYIKGRDWFDFLWYVSNKVQINYTLLESALMQAGPFKDEKLQVNKSWVIQNLQQKMTEIDWKVARLDVESFLKASDQKYVQSWSGEFFISMLKKLENYLL